MGNSDRELLDLAAKAAGIALYWPDDATFDEGWALPQGPLRPNRNVREKRHWPEWNPLTDDGDALRLAVELGIQITPGTYLTQSATAYCPGSQAAEEHVHYQQDMLTATRRAIVRAAAEIGKTVQDKSVS